MHMSAIMGKFQGIKVYKTTLPEYVNMRLYKDEENMYVIDGDMIYKNEIFAKWDGKYVNELDPYERAVYYTIPKFANEVSERGTQSANGNDIREYTFDISFSSGKMTVEEKNETKTEPMEVVKAEDVLGAVFNDDALAAAYDTDYSNLFTDVDAFLKNALKK